jgi:hypothetical protein
MHNSGIYECPFKGTIAAAEAKRPGLLNATQVLNKDIEKCLIESKGTSEHPRLNEWVIAPIGPEIRAL